MQLAGYSINELLEIYRQDLFDDFLPYLDTHIYDEKFGGFMCHTDQSGNQVSQIKRTWYDGRGIWVYSYLYRHFGQQKKYLDKADKTIAFLREVESSEYPYWPWGYSREGSPIKNQTPDIYGALFIAEGLTAYSAASGREMYWDKAKSILLSCVEEYDRKNYQYSPHYTTSETTLQAPRVLGHWMIILNLCGQMLDQKDDPVVRNLSDRSIEALLEHHLHPRFNLLIEYLNHDLILPESPLDQFAYTGHGMEVLWMIMAEAERREDNLLYEKAADLFKRHVELSWDGVYGGFFHELTHVTENKWLTDKVLWAQEEVLTGLMLMIAKNRDPWAMRWFDRVYPYVRENFILHDHRNRLWVNGGDRIMEEHHQVDRFENYHHPRHLMMNIRVLERMLSHSVEPR